MYGRFFGLLALRNTTGIEGQARADDKEPLADDKEPLLPRADELGVGAISFGVQSVQEHLSPG